MIYTGGLPKKRGGGLDSLQIKEGAWQKTGEKCFRGGVDTPVHTMITQEGNIKTRQMTLFFIMFVMASTENMVLNGDSR